MAPLKSRILSATRDTVLIYQLIRSKVKDAKCLQQAICLSRYRWKVKFKVPIGNNHSPSVGVPYSFIGDLFVATTPSYFSLWHKTAGKPFECLILCAELEKQDFSFNYKKRIARADEEKGKSYILCDFTPGKIFQAYITLSNFQLHRYSANSNAY